MDWIETFYTRQDEWAAVCAEPVGPEDRRRAKHLESWIGACPKRILDLGCDGGQTAYAIADRGHLVVAVDRVQRVAEAARHLASTRQDRRMTVVQGDFFLVDLNGPFDAVCCFDGFGTGTDADQRRLLRRIDGWLEPRGTALVEIYAPWYWAHAAGRTMAWGDVSRRYDYDLDTNRMLDTWWRTADPSSAVTQSLRCYAPGELRELLNPLPLALHAVVPGGAYDPDAATYRSSVPLREVMQYTAVLRHRRAVDDRR